jgi:hypothetical protein
VTACCSEVVETFVAPFSLLGEIRLGRGESGRSFSSSLLSARLPTARQPSTEQQRIKEARACCQAHYTRLGKRTAATSSELSSNGNKSLEKTRPAERFPPLSPYAYLAPLPITPCFHLHQRHGTHSRLQRRLDCFAPQADESLESL